MRDVYFARVLCCAIALTLTNVIAASTPAAASAPGLSAQQVGALGALGVRVALPTYVPAGYSLEEVRITPCEYHVSRRSCSSGPDYIVRYHNGDAWFSFEETTGDLGGTSLTYKTFVKTKIFGTVPLRFGSGGDGIGLTPSASDLQAVQREVYCDWLGAGPYYHLIGERIAPAVMVKILASVDWQRGR